MAVGEEEVAVALPPLGEMEGRSGACACAVCASVHVAHARVSLRSVHMFTSMVRYFSWREEDEGGKEDERREGRGEERTHRIK